MDEPNVVNPQQISTPLLSLQEFATETKTDAAIEPILEKLSAEFSTNEESKHSEIIIEIYRRERMCPLRHKGVRFP